MLRDWGDEVETEGRLRRNGYLGRIPESPEFWKINKKG